MLSKSIFRHRGANATVALASCRSEGLLAANRPICLSRRRFGGSQQAPKAVGGNICL